jgi:hypothetical protein
MGFKPSAKMRKLLADRSTVVYVHKDGIVIAERKSVKIDKTNFMDVYVWHVMPCEIRLFGYAYDQDYNRTIHEIDMIQITNARLIVNGLDSIEINFDLWTKGTKEKDIKVVSFSFACGDHEWNEIKIVGAYTPSVKAYPDPTDKWGNYTDKKSVRDYQNLQYSAGNTVIVYGELPEEKKESEQYQLTVSS